MSAPDMKARPPAPASTITRVASSREKSSMISGTASHISTDTALCRAGLLKIIQPTAPFLRAIMRSVLTTSCIGSHHLARAKIGDRRGVISKLAQHFVRMLAGIGRRALHAVARARELNRLVHDLGLAQARMPDRRRHAEMPDLGIGEDLVHLIDRATRHARLIENLDPLRARLAARDLADRRIERGA